ncbi:MAG: S46 family peptidase [Bacteroidales bacterium]|nr:S46 family peptidase [Bacteroidales bacterium]
MRQTLFVLFFTGFLIKCFTTLADEGMWLPILLQQQKIDDMQSKGLKLTAEDIYSINQACLKDAIVLFGGGCTGEIVSDDGLLLTNYHCGHAFVRGHSSVENDYLTNGYWAKSREEELFNQNLSVSILHHMEDITGRILYAISTSITEDMRNNIIKSRIESMVDSIEGNTHFKAEITSFYYGNAYYLFVYEKFKDVRLVGAPPEAIGGFGGDTDNWIWPRHTGDFCVFRIYSDTNNLPSDYSEDNIPYHPRKSLSISLKGINEGDFTMVYGYPFHTTEYITSYEVENLLYSNLPQKINVRRGRLDIIEKAMYSDPALYIQFASTQANIANAWKKWIGMEKGLKHRNAVNEKKEFENDFIHWSDSIGNNDYSQLMEQYRLLFSESREFDLVYEYGYEVVMASDLLNFVSSFLGALNDYYLFMDKEENIRNLQGIINKHFKGTYIPVEKESFRWLMESFYRDIKTDFHPAAFYQVKKNFKGDFEDYTNYVYNTSIFADEEKITNFLDEPSEKMLKKDPLYELYMDFITIYSEKVYPSYFRIKSKIDSLNRIYMKAILDMNAGYDIYPDANGSLRVTYGKIEGYSPADGIKYDYYTTLEGIMQKEDTTIYDYKVPEELKKLYEMKDYGRYGIDSVMHVCFTASNHTSGGNSGSPVLNAEGQLIGINFDRNWEGTMSDIMYDPEICRNICVDIRYVLFIIDKYAGAGYLLDEMHFVE